VKDSTPHLYFLSPFEAERKIEIETGLGVKSPLDAI
jgi:hypothetical protein